MNWTKIALADHIAQRGYEIGDHSYGVPTLHHWFDQSAKLRIGKYCSIAAGVSIMLGGNHHTEWITTYPLPAVYGKTKSGMDVEACEFTRGDVCIGSDVWIGQCATILSGVTIGHGAVIGAHAVISDDVPPYVVVVGNPARVTRQRFPPEEVARLLELRWWDWPDEEVAAFADNLMTSDLTALFRNRDATHGVVIQASSTLAFHVLDAQQTLASKRDKESGLATSTTTDSAVRDLVANTANPRDLYLNLLIKCITNTIYGDANKGSWRSSDYDAEARRQGVDWPEVAHSMVGVLRLENLCELTQSVLRDGIPGDLIETGVWRGGSCILMRAILRAYGDITRKVYLADSFRGLPPPNAIAYPADAGETIHMLDFMAISKETVANNFRAYDLLDDQVVFVEGWFKDTLPALPVERLAIIRLDGDMYESTIQALEALYPKLSIGGFLIVDDFGSWESCRQAVHDYRTVHDIDDPIVTIDTTGVYWRRTR